MLSYTFRRHNQRGEVLGPESAENACRLPKTHREEQPGGASVQMLHCALLVPVELDDSVLQIWLILVHDLLRGMLPPCQ